MATAAELVFLQSAIDEEMRKKKMRTGLKTWHQTPFNPSIYRRNEGRFYGEIKRRPRDFLWRVSQVGVGVIDQNTSRSFEEAKKSANLSINAAYQGLSASMGAWKRGGPGAYTWKHKVVGTYIALISPTGAPPGRPRLYWKIASRFDPYFRSMDMGVSNDMTSAIRSSNRALQRLLKAQINIKPKIGALESRNPLLEKQWASKEPVPSFTYDTRYGVVEPIHWYANPTKIEILSGHDEMDDADEELSEMQASGFGKGWW